MQEVTDDTTRVSIPVEDDSALIHPSSTVTKRSNKNQAWIGNTYAMCYRNGVPAITIGPHCINKLNIILGPLYVCLNLITFPITICCILFVVVKVTIMGTVIGILILLAQFSSYTLVFLINPGIPNKNQVISDEASIARIRDNR